MRPVSRHRLRARAADRRPPKPVWWKAATAFGAFATGASALSLVCVLAWKLGAPQEFAHLAGQRFAEWTEQRGLAVRSVVVNGLDRVSRRAVLDALALRDGGSILSVDTKTARRRIEDLPWVVRARVERRLPDALVIDVEESRPIARHLRGGELFGVDDRGDLVRVSDAAPLAPLPALFGEGSPEAAPALVAALETEPSLVERVSRAHLVRGRRWNVVLDGGLVVRLPETDLARAWSRLARVDDDRRLTEKAVRAIDLRNPDWLAVELLDAAGEA